MTRHAVVAVLLIFASAAAAQTAPPPRSVADVLAVLDQYKPDPEKVNRLKADAARPPPQTTDRVDLFKFHLARGEAAGQLCFASSTTRPARAKTASRSMPYAHPMFWAPFSLVGDGN